MASQTREFKPRKDDQAYWTGRYAAEDALFSNKESQRDLTALEQKSNAQDRLKSLDSFYTDEQLFGAFELGADFSQPGYRKTLYTAVQKGFVPFSALLNVPAEVKGDEPSANRDKKAIVAAGKQKVASVFDSEEAALEFLKYFSTEGRSLPAEAEPVLWQLAERYLEAAIYIFQTRSLAQILDKSFAHKSPRYQIYQKHRHSLELAFLAGMPAKTDAPNNKARSLSDGASQADRVGNLANFIAQVEEEKTTLDTRVIRLRAQQEAYRKRNELNGQKIDANDEKATKLHTEQVKACDALVTELAAHTKADDKMVAGELVTAQAKSKEKGELLDTLVLRQFAALQGTPFHAEDKAMGTFYALADTKQAWKNVQTLVARQPMGASVLRTQDVEAMFALANTVEKFKEVLRYLLNNNKQVLLASNYLKNNKLPFISSVTEQDVSSRQHADVYEQLSANPHAEVSKFYAATFIRRGARNASLGFFTGIAAGIADAVGSSYGDDARTKAFLKGYVKAEQLNQKVCKFIVEDSHLWSLLLATVPPASRGFFGYGKRTQQQVFAERQALIEKVRAAAGLKELESAAAPTANPVVADVKEDPIVVAPTQTLAAAPQTPTKAAVSSAAVPSSPTPPRTPTKSANNTSPATEMTPVKRDAANVAATDEATAAAATTDALPAAEPVERELDFDGITDDGQNTRNVTGDGIEVDTAKPVNVLSTASAAVVAPPSPATQTAEEAADEITDDGQNTADVLGERITSDDTKPVNVLDQRITHAAVVGAANSSVISPGKAAAGTPPVRPDNSAVVVQSNIPTLP